MFRLFITSVMLIFCCSALAGESPNCESIKKALSHGNPTQKLSKFLKERWQYILIDNPELATSLGFPGQNDRWQDLSLAAFERREREDICQLTLLQKIPHQPLQEADKLNFTLMEHILEMSIERAQFGEKYLAIDRLGGLHTDIPDTLARMPKAKREDYENMLARLQRVPEVELQTEALLREGMKRKITAVKMLLLEVPEQFDQVLQEKVEDSPIYQAFTEIKAPLTSMQKAELQQHAKEIIANSVYPALRKLKNFLISEYIPAAQESISLKDMPNGEAWYAYNIRKYTTTNMTAEQLHELGLREVARITTEMEKIREAVKFSGDLKAFNRFLLSDKRFFYSDKEELLSGYRDIAKRIDPELPRLFGTLPRLTYGVHEIPAYKAKTASAAYYEVGSLEGGRPGYFAANTSDLASRPKWAMEVLTSHEAVPGHHFQIAIAQELKSRPEILRHSSNEAFSEGWGLYAESLGEQIGLYKDPYSKYGELSYEMWRAVRLVVDTGIHSKGWSRAQALTYFSDHLPKTKEETQTEVDRYITWPGQALAYKVGQLKFLELRHRAQTAFGEHFDIRKFHDQLLSRGALPLNVLDKVISDWIDQETKRIAQLKAKDDKY